MLAKGTDGKSAGVALILLAGLFWSITGPVIRQLEAADAWQVTALRSAGMAATLALFIALRNRGQLIGPIRAAGLGGMVGGLALASAFVSYILSVSLTTIATTLFLLAAMPMFAAALGWLLLREPVPPLTRAAIAVAALGVLVMVADGLDTGSPAGVGLALLCALSFAAYAVLLRRRGLAAASGRLTDAAADGNAERASAEMPDSLPAAFWGGVISAVAVAVLLIADRGGAAFALPAGDVVACLLLGVVQLGCGVACFTLGAPRVPAAQAALLTLVEPALGPLWTWLAVGEVPSTATFLGGGIVIAAVSLQAAALARLR